MGENKYQFKGTDSDWQPYGVKRKQYEVVDQNGQLIANCPDTIMASDREMEANMHLIAAAPELLQACISFIEKVEDGRARSTNSYSQMKRAVKKALNIQD